MADPVRFATRLVLTERGHVRAPVPFDPRQQWGSKPRHYVAGTIRGTAFSGSVGFSRDGAFLVLPKDFRATAGVQPGDTVEVEIRPVDGPVRSGAA